MSQYQLMLPPCWLCGWARARRQRHRILPGKQGGQYERPNIFVLCPNCHALAHDDPDAFFADLARALLLGKAEALDHFSKQPAKPAD